MLGSGSSASGKLVNILASLNLNQNDGSDQDAARPTRARLNSCGLWMKQQTLMQLDNGNCMLGSGWSASGKSVNIPASLNLNQNDGSDQDAARPTRARLNSCGLRMKQQTLLQLDNGNLQLISIALVGELQFDGQTNFCLFGFDRANELNFFSLSLPLVCKWLTNHIATELLPEVVQLSGRSLELDEEDALDELKRLKPTKQYNNAPHTKHDNAQHTKHDNAQYGIPSKNSTKTHIFLSDFPHLEISIYGHI